MAWPKFSASALSLAGVVLLVGGLGIAVLGTQTSTESRSHAMEESGGSISTTDAIGIHNCNEIYHGTCIGASTSCSGKVVKNLCGTNNNCCSGVIDSQVKTTLQLENTCTVTNKGKCVTSKTCNASQGTRKGYCDSAQTSACCVKQSTQIDNGGGQNNTNGVGSKCTVNNVVGTCLDKNVASNCKGGTYTPKYCPGLPTNVQCCILKNAPASGDTKFTLTMLFHGIGQGGDNRNPNGGGNPTPVHKPRKVTVEVHDVTSGAKIVSKEANATFNDSAGNFTITNLDMGTLSSKTYTITIISQSLRKSITQAVTAGKTNTFSATLVNGDAYEDGQLDIQDYNLIFNCLSDFGITPDSDQCDETQAQQSDIDDDGTVGVFDLNLLIRELSVQKL